MFGIAGAEHSDAFAVFPGSKCQSSYCSVSINPIKGPY